MNNVLILSMLGKKMKKKKKKKKKKKSAIDNLK